MVNVSDPSAEKELLVQLQSGDEAAFDFFYQKYSRVIYGNILRMVKSPDIAQELLQDVFVKVWEKRNTLNPDLSFKAYLFKISQNLVYNYFRRGAIDQKVKIYLAGIQTELHNSVEDGLTDKENRDFIEGAIEQLSPQRKLIYTLCKLEGKSYEEVSSMLNISTSTISDHIVKANRFIKERHQQFEGSIIAVAVFLLHNL